MQFLHKTGSQQQGYTCEPLIAALYGDSAGECWLSKYRHVHGLENTLVKLLERRWFPFGPVLHTDHRGNYSETRFEILAVPVTSNTVGG